MLDEKPLTTWEDAVVWLRNQPDRRQLVLDAFYDDPLIDAAERYFASAEWQAVSGFLEHRTGKALDVGAGRGIASYALARSGFVVTALEPDPSAVVGTAAIRLPDGLIVSALVAVNAIGDVVDPATGQLVAGVRTEDGKSMADVRRLLRAGALGGAEPGANTTLAVVATNARMTKTQMAKVAQMAHDGFARAIVPVHTPADGDTAFAIATGSLGRGADLLVVGSLAADVTAQAIVSAARAATGLPSLPAARDLPH